VFALYILHYLTYPKKNKIKPHTVKQKTAIVTGGKMTKALCVARQLKQEGCRVILVETHK